MREKVEVQVRFIESPSGDVLGDVRLDAALLPGSFATNTRLQLGADDWEVIGAEPAEADAFVASGALTLTIRHIVSNADALGARPALFGTPTIADAPPYDDAVPTAHRLGLAPHAWRQLELIAMRHERAARSELERIERIVLAHRVPRGFGALHVRAGIDDPVAGAHVRIADLAQRFGEPAERFEGIALGPQGLGVRGGFAFRTIGGLVVYGAASGDEVTVLAFVAPKGKPGHPRDVAALRALRTQHQLLLVDWPARTLVSPPSRSVQ